MALIFIGGVHGVGKSSVCAEVATELGLRVHSASAVIRAERGKLNPDQGKTVVDVDANQRLLVQGVRRHVAGSSGVQLLDGHFALRAATGNIECIGICVFEQIGIRHVVCFRDQPQSILERLALRDGYDGSLAAIADLQQAEIQHAKFVSRHLGVPVNILSAFDSGSLRGLLVRAIREHVT